MRVANFLPEQYDHTDACAINHNYLERQFSDYEEIFSKIAEVVRKGDFTLGRAVDVFEQRWASMIGAKHAVGVGSGTDALFLSLRALGVGLEDEVITTPFTFYATVGAIVATGAKPVFVDIADDYNINAELIEEKITSRTKAILPVHWSGKPCEMDKICGITEKYNLFIVEDACHAIGAKYQHRYAGTFGKAGCFSMHPLKNINVWGDGGVICTDDDALANQLRLMRNHGLINRNKIELFGYNSRLDTIQAVVANHLLDKLEHITNSRIQHAKYFDEQLKAISGIRVPSRPFDLKQVYHIYSICVPDRDKLVEYLIENGIDAKVHYPIPIHLQPAAEFLGYTRGSFPCAEAVSESTISLPVHEFITSNDQDVIVKHIRKFYS